MHVARDAAGPDIPEAASVIVYLNHCSWWDPLTCLLIWRHQFTDRPAYAPMDAAQLERFAFFRKMGFFPVAGDSASSTRAFLRTADAILARDKAMLWLTPQARFADTRERPLAFAPGLAHLVRQQPKVWFAPVAFEYVFWDDRLPEVLIRWGPAISAESLLTKHGKSLDAINADLESRLELTMNALAHDACKRSAEPFEPILHSPSGVSPMMDLWHRIRGQRPGAPLK